MTCPKCGSDIINNTTVCPECKTNVSAYIEHQNPYPTDVVKKQRKGTPIIIAGCIIAFAFVVALLLVLFVSKNKPESKKQNTSTVSTESNQPREYGNLTYEIVRNRDKIDQANGTEPCGVACYEDGKMLWEYTESVPLGMYDPIYEKLISDDSFIFTSIGEDLIALDKFTGEIIWRAETIGAVFSILMDENHLYVAGHEGFAVDVFYKDGTLIENDVKPFTGRIVEMDFADDNTIRVTYLPEFDGSDTDTFDIDISQYKVATSPINPNNSNNLLIYPMSYDFLSPEGDIVYYADNVLDGNPKTVWAEGKSGIGSGAELFFTVAANKEISGLKILAGHNKTETLYYYNCRPSQIKITDSSGNTETVNLADSYGEYQTVNFAKPMKGRITITILDAYSGTVYQDTCISEITAF